MITGKRKHDAGIHEAEQVTKRTSSPSNSAVLGYNAHAPWLHDAKPSRAWRTLGDRAVPPSLPLANMVSTVQDLIDPDFDPLVAILDDEPRFLKPLPSRIAPEDLEFLRFRGALSIPESELRNELLRCYIKWVHSFIPVINLQEFLRCVAENDPKGNISLLLFQAVMFVATAFIDFKHLQAAGYSSRKQARNAFYTPLRLLYSLDCEDDRIVILQTLLLMTYWCDLMNHPNRDIWDWIGICNIQAHSIGLNRDPSSTPNMDQKTKRLRVRLWWSLYARDRLIAMGLRRPTQVNEGTSNVPLVRLEDFDFEPYHPAVVELFHCRQLEDSSHQKRLATMFIEKTKLCQSIGRVLFAQYSPSQRQFGMTHRTTIALVPRQASESELARCSQRLESWLHSLPKDAQFIPAARPNFEDGEDVLLLHGAMLRMLYHTTISALHRPWAFPTTKGDNKARHELANTARIKMHDAAVGITQIIQGLNRLNLTRFLPQSGVTVITPAAVAHLASTMSDNPSVREAGIFNFQRCIQVLQGMKEIYPAADMEMANVEAAVKVQTGSVGTFLRIMQYNDTKPDPQRRKDSLAPTVQTIQSPVEEQIPPNWAVQDSTLDQQNQPQHPSHPQPPTHTLKQPNNLATSNTCHRTPSLSVPKQEEQPSPPDHFTSHFTNSIFHDRSPPSTANPYTQIDFLKPRTESYPDSSILPEMDVNWAEELLRDTDLSLDFSGTADEDFAHDVFVFPPEAETYTAPDAGAGCASWDAHHSPRPRAHPRPHRQNTNGDITGDLDRDLGINLSGDEMF